MCYAWRYGMQYDAIQGQGHDPLKGRNPSIFEGWQMTTDS